MLILRNLQESINIMATKQYLFVLEVEASLLLFSERAN